MDIRRWLRDDRRTPVARRLERDRAIGLTLGARTPLKRVLAWWTAIRSSEDPGDDAAAPRLGDRVVAGRRLVTVALVVLGFVVGAGVAGVALGYEGRYPVNLFTLLGVLVGLPLAMLLLTLLLMPGRVPGLGALQAVVAGMNLGRWAGAWLDRFLGAELFAPGLLGSGSASAFSRWQLVVFSQCLALGFFAGAIAIALLRVTFTDLAFGWSTTLDMDPGLVHGWVAALSSPWSAWLPQAAPDAALVEASRYFRLEDGRMPPERVAQLGDWWPFVLMTVLVYGALPRLVLLVLGAWRLHAATVSLVTDDPEVTALLDRLDTPAVGLGADAEEEADHGDGQSVPAPAGRVVAEGLVVVIWNHAVTGEQARRWLTASLGVDAECVLELGILMSEADQRRALASARRGGSVRRVVLISKGWEPPLLEFMDFLGVLRDELGGDCSVTVVPMDVAGEKVRRAERDVWARALTRARDTRLYVAEAEA